MKTLLLKIKNSFTIRKLVAITFSLSIVFLVSGSILVYLSTQSEKLDDKYIISTMEEYNSNTLKKPEKGEILVKKDIVYKGKGTYNIIFKNYAKEYNDNEPLKENTTLKIKEILGEGYKLNSNKIVINKKECKIKEENTICSSGIIISYTNNILNIEIPNEIVLKTNIIKADIKLEGRDINKKYVTSKESYYSFIPNINNDFYIKKQFQSYIINGEGYIKLTKKK